MNRESAPVMTTNEWNPNKTYIERLHVQIKDTLPEQEWVILIESFKIALSILPGREETANSHIGYSLTPYQSAFFTDTDIQVLLRLAFGDGPLQCTDGWKLVDLHGRKSLYINCNLFKARLVEDEKYQIQKREKALKADIVKFIQTFIRKESSSRVYTQPQDVYTHFILSCNYTPEDVSSLSFYMIFEEILGISRVRRGYSGIKLVPKALKRKHDQI